MQEQLTPQLHSAGNERTISFSKPPWLVNRNPSPSLPFILSQIRDCACMLFCRLAQPSGRGNSLLSLGYYHNPLSGLK
ncbi:hypothetical protein DPMN_173944 [Dreissena polymorpha]|uniref:Uncharacterized protein n=1 Tax=Dreissena polymorpha TaxID=45954 RepID=A0A9D4E4F3_DREPO|nr:hypothetical protein DPMN_173944 [Dreissena polymorpha]